MYRILILLAANQVTGSGGSTKICKIPMSIKATSISQQNNRKPCSLLQRKGQCSPSTSIVSKQISSFKLAKNAQALVPLPSSFKIVNATLTVQSSNDVKGGNVSMQFSPKQNNGDKVWIDCSLRTLIFAIFNSSSSQEL